MLPFFILLMTASVSFANDTVVADFGGLLIFNEVGDGNGNLPYIEYTLERLST
jgi:hypothetical protein